MTNEELIEYYTNLLIIQYQLPKARDTIRAFINSGMIFELIISVRDGYNVDTATGAQLDVIAKLVGVSRTIFGTAFSRDYWGFAKYGDVSPFTFAPFMKYGDAVPDVQWRQYDESQESLYDLNDEELRTVIKLKIIQNNSNFSVAEIDDFIADFFPGQALFFDNQDMTISYIFEDGAERLVTIAQSQGLLPKPAAVGGTVSFTPDTGSVFSFQKYGESAPSYARGFAKYGDTGIVGGMAKYGTRL